MRLFLTFLLTVILDNSLFAQADKWPPVELKGAWLVTYASSDGDEVEQAKDNIVVFHDSRMVFVFDRNYRVTFDPIKSDGSKSYGLTHVQRGELKFMLERTVVDNLEEVDVRLLDYPNNRVREHVRYKLVRMELDKAMKRIRWVLGSPKYEEGKDTRPIVVETLEDWLKTVQVGEQSHEPLKSAK